ncbi:pheophytinase, chloroplastic [Gossypium australe]|uniref:Pheophytinase, chloroplastic n=1 Tax=Gossypium australe TaxID=47621 RepID=A0A5B6UM23_9ROSI|nr:pheophytinase, chloroplastic [Gossypium australe]
MALYVSQPYNNEGQTIEQNFLRFFAPSRINFQPRSKCEMINRRGFALKGIVASGVSVMGSSLTSEPVQGVERLPFKPDGYNFWTWRGRKIHYVVQGEGFPIVLIHGFGASAFHWRYNIPELAKNYKVYAVDLLGFGWSEKAIIEYDAMIWRDQVVDFLKEIVKEPTVLVGNSLGGFTALVAAVGLPEQVVGLALLNSAGQFGDAKAKTTESEETFLQKFVLKPLKEVFQRVVLQVYINTSNVDDYLVESIKMPADDPNAGEVYYRYYVVPTLLLFSK